jgi:HD-like signal output (HDOD) protein
MPTLTTTAALPEKILTLLQQKVQHLQMLPGVAMQALDAVRDRNTSISKFTSIVERDMKLTAKILTLANSPAFFTGRSVVNLHQAVTRLGFRQCQNLILTASMAALQGQMDMREQWIREMLWQHGFLTALIAMQVNRCASAGFEGEEFIAGLMHDVGRTLLATCLCEEFTSFDRLDFEENRWTPRLEESRIGCSHADVGAWFAASSRIPEELIAVIRHHHDPSAAPDHRKLVALIATSDHMANYIQRGGLPESYDVRTNEAVAILERFGLPGAAVKIQDSSATILVSSQSDASEMAAL